MHENDITKEEADTRAKGLKKEDRDALATRNGILNKAVARLMREHDMTKEEAVECAKHKGPTELKMLASANNTLAENLLLTQAVPCWSTTGLFFISPGIQPTVVI